MKVRMIAILLAATACAGAAFADVSEVETESGVLRGFASAHQPEVTVFEGIAFAAPPVGELRWRPPAAPIPFAGVKDADRIG
ncbi:MAG: carboxylesterase family protein, partial [Gammaproteobacteria bacterium]|nr:carboxylesterase family protein [Gammaproteobacteria bacterium]